jgi:hypothetical protein
MSDNYIVKINNPFEPYRRDLQSVPYMKGRTIEELIELSGIKSSVIVLRNGHIVTDYRIKLLPEDVIHICPQIHDDPLKSIGMIGIAVLAAYVIGPAASSLVGGGVGGAIFGGIASVATIAVGGMLLNPGLSQSANNATAFEESPTYHWDIRDNPVREGLAIPVIYGNVISYPIIINQWLDAVSGEQWAHTLLLVAEGVTNNEPTADDIYVDDQQLSHIDENDYVLVTTDGSSSPSWGSNTDFTTPHQMRSINKELKHSYVSNFLLHCNGTDGSTTIEDDSENGSANNWTCISTCELSTAVPFLGSACLDLQGSGYLSCGNPEAFDIWTDEFMTIECRFRQSTLADSGIMGQSRIVSGGDEYYWGLFYIHSSTSIVFQQWKVTSGGVYTIYYDVVRSASLSPDTWHHICVQKWGTDQLRLYLDGDLKGSAASGTAPIDPPGGSWSQEIGRARHYISGTDSWIYGDFRLDEIRLISQGIAYNYTGFTAPSAELTDQGSEEYTYTTKGAIDKFGVIITAPYGIYYVDTDSSLDPNYVPFHVSYRKVGDTDWETEYNLFWGQTRNTWRMRFDFTVSKRGIYEIKIRRSTIDDPSTFHQTTTMLSYIDEYLDVQLRYPDLQCVGISLRAQNQLSAQVPSFKVVSNRSSISIPNYNGYGNQTVNPTKNAYAAIDILTNSTYGGDIDIDRFIEDDWEDWVDWTETTVMGKRRSQVNIIFDSIMSLDEALQQIENCGRARIIKRGTSLSVVIDKPSSPVALFGAGNVVPESDRVKWLRQAERSDAVEVSYRDMDLEYIDQKVSYLSSNYHSLTRKPRIVRLNLFGVNNRDQAKREAIFRQQLSESIKKSVELQSGLEAIPVISGDVINYQASINSFSGRLPLSNNREQSWTGTTVYLDQKVNLASATFSGNCILMVRDPDDTLQTYTISGPFDIDTWTVTVTSSGTFNYLSNYTICRNIGDPYQYKVVQMERTNKLDIKISAMQYDSTAYYNSDYEAGSVAI